MSSYFSALFCFPSCRKKEETSELSDQEIAAIKESWARARHGNVGTKILAALIDKKPKFADYYGIAVDLDVDELHRNSAFNVQARRIQNFLDTVVSSLGLCPDDTVYSMARRIGQIHYYKGVNFGADNWLVFKKVTVDQVIAAQEKHKDKLEKSIHDLTLASVRCSIATVGWNRFMSIIIREMKRGFLDEANRNCKARGEGE